MNCSAIRSSAINLLSKQVACIFVCVFLVTTDALADFETDYRIQVLKEIQSSLSNKDKDLAEQLVDIRIEQEKKMGRYPNSSKHELPQNSKTTNSTINIFEKKPAEIFNSNSSNNANRTFESDGSKSLYTAIGNRFVVGYSWGKSENIGIRTELSGSSKTDGNKNVDGSRYDFYEKSTSLGAYIDWYPSKNQFRLSSGISVNDMRTRLNGISNSNIFISGNQLALGGNSFNVDFKFPTVTPFVGFGFTKNNSELLGLNFYGDLGFMIGKYNATAYTNLIGTQFITAANVDAEINNLRKSLYKYSFIPLANIGLSYRYN